MSQQGTVLVVSPLQAFEQRAIAFFHTEKAKVIAFADKFLPSVGSAIEVGLEDIAEICGAAVLAEAPRVLSGEEKFGNAVTTVVQTLEAQGNAIAIQTAQAGVQGAFLAARQVAGDLTP